MLRGGGAYKSTSYDSLKVIWMCQLSCLCQIVKTLDGWSIFMINGSVCHMNTHKLIKL